MKTKEINELMDKLKSEGVSAVIVATKDFSDGYYRAITSDTVTEDIHITDLLNGLAKASSALRARLKEISKSEGVTA
jgi:hypothetical protein